MIDLPIQVVLAHAVWFDASSWWPVIELLRKQGIGAAAAQLPHTSLGADVTAVRALMRRAPGPIVLVGHSYGGAVITAAGAGDDRVKALVYVAAIVPDAGETVGDIFTRAAPHPEAPRLTPDPDGFLWVTADDFARAVAPDSGAGEAALFAATQKPIAVQCLSEKLTGAAWREKPSTFLVTERDRMVSPETQRFTAERMKSEIRLLASDHSPLHSHATAIAEAIARRAR